MGVMKNQYIEGNCLKKGGLGSLQILGGLGKKEGGVDTPMHTMLITWAHIHDATVLTKNTS